MLWFLLAVLFSIFNAAAMLVNDRFKVDGNLMSAMRGLGVSAAFFPALFFVEFPESPSFWAMVILQGLMSAYYSSKLYEASAIYGAGSTARVSVLSLLFAVAFWWILDFGSFVELLRAPASLAVLVLSLAAVVWGFVKMTSKGRDRAGARYLMPAVVVFAAMMVNRKEIMEGQSFADGIVYYCAVSIFISGVSNAAIYCRRNSFAAFVGELGRRRTLLAGALMAAASALTLIAGNSAAYYVPNPGYVNAVSLLSPVWIMLPGLRGAGRERPALPAVAAMLLGLFGLVMASSGPWELPHI